MFMIMEINSLNQPMIYKIVKIVFNLSFIKIYPSCTEKFT
jgi:hypothetical protein